LQQSLDTVDDFHDLFTRNLLYQLSRFLIDKQFLF